jgi:hypothetical protein
MAFTRRQLNGRAFMTVAQMLAATDNAFASLAVCYFWAENRLNEYALQAGTRLKALNQWTDYDEATTGLAGYIAIIVGLTGFVLMAGLGISRRPRAATVLFSIPAIIWFHALVLSFASLSEWWFP